MQEVKATEQYTTVAGGSISAMDQHQKPSLSEAVGTSKSFEEPTPNNAPDTRLLNNVSMLKKVSTMFSKAFPARRSIWSLTIFRVVVLVVLFAILVSRWRYLVF